MQTETFRNRRNLFNSMQNPVPELIELNMQTLRNISFIQPGDLSSLKNPQELFDKSMRMFINNGHKMLEYFQHATEILEKNWLSSSHQAMTNLRQGMQQSREAMDQPIRKRPSSRRKAH
ncbi:MULTISPECIES: hypothetical protein [Legionella]|uniref:Phasin protein n=1 Tax=Legionella maceachernii TaxID=466 RepID=A0A0W0W061_9GAMM|nr:hypothetical protein [Legionella maceachernii]KTD25635.1 hypothetical protein Lmac_1999 [Legionella maceachernii]SJZ58163.1 hypothetical protein SAMN02745128_00491 [Legionella maceachernii]SUP00698.1 Uncharacterised protein [Legionella maceachernii]